MDWVIKLRSHSAFLTECTKGGLFKIYTHVINCFILTLWCRAGHALHPGCNKDPLLAQRLLGDSRGAAATIWTGSWRDCETHPLGGYPVPATPCSHPLECTEWQITDIQWDETNNKCWLGDRTKTHQTLSINQCIHELPWDNTYQRTANPSSECSSLLDKSARINF